MEKKELAKYAGKYIFCVVSRAGGMYRDIHQLNIYRITERGTLRYHDTVMPCVANKRQWELCNYITECKMFGGRPTAEQLTANQVEWLISAERLGND